MIRSDHEWKEPSSMGFWNHKTIPTTFFLVFVFCLFGQANKISRIHWVPSQIRAQPMYTRSTSHPKTKRQKNWPPHAIFKLKSTEVSNFHLPYTPYKQWPQKYLFLQPRLAALPLEGFPNYIIINGPKQK